MNHCSVWIPPVSVYTQYIERDRFFVKSGSFSVEFFLTGLLDTPDTPLFLMHRSLVSSCSSAMSISKDIQAVKWSIK